MQAAAVAISVHSMAPDTFNVESGDLLQDRTKLSAAGSTRYKVLP